MTRLLEHVAKSVLNDHGVTIPKGILCTSPHAAAQAADELGAPVFVKAQVPVGNRGPMGGVVRAETASEAEHAAQRMLGYKFLEFTCEGVLVEEALQPSRTLYVAVRVNPIIASRELLVGDAGGTGYDPESAAFRLEFDRHVDRYRLRLGLKRLGVTGVPMLRLSELLAAMIDCACRWHTYVVELNPVVICDDGRVVAADAKIELDDYSAGLVPDPAKVADAVAGLREREANIFQRQDHRGSLRFVQLVDDGAGTDGLVGTHSVGGGESLVVLDALAEFGLRAANYCDTSGSPSEEKVAFAAALVATQPGIEGYFFSTCIANQPLSVTAAGLIKGLNDAGWSGPTVLRVAGNEEEDAHLLLTAWGARHSSPVRIFGRETNEWEAARAMRELLGTKR